MDQRLPRTLSADLLVRDLTVRFGPDETGAALDALDLVVGGGRVGGVVGPSGCGKSTLLRVAAGLLTPQGGEVRVGDESVIGRPGRVAYMPQRDLLLPWRRAMENALLGAEVAGLDLQASRDRASTLFGRFGLHGFESAWPHQLSGGMRQRLALLRTFLLPQPVLLLDEPFGALDPITRPSLVSWLGEVLAEDPRTVVLVTHDVEEALRLCDDVWVLSERPGRVLAHVPVGLPRPRPPELVIEPDFVDLRRTVLRALSGEGRTGGVAPT